MNMEKEQLEKLALTVATLVADISQKVVSSWKNELKVLKNIEVHPSGYGTLLLEASMFGHYYVGEKFKQNMSKDDQKIFSNELDDKMVLMVSLLLDHKDKDKDFEAHKKMIREMYEKFAPEAHKQLAEYRGNSIHDVFKVRLRQTFNNTDDFKMKFFENSFKNRLRLKFAGLLSGDGSSNKYANDTFLDEKIIYLLADSLFAEFSTLDYNELSKQAEEMVL